jgi:putative SOS response-associated peptidase YedK
VWRFCTADISACCKGFGPSEQSLDRLNLAPEIAPPPAIVSRSGVAPILRMHPKDNRIELVLAHWQFPTRSMSASLGSVTRRKTSTAKAEALWNSQTFGEAFSTRRCIVPATAWLECVRKLGRRIQWEIRPKEGGPIYFAGLWEEAANGKSDACISFVIITEPAGPSLAPYNYRAPVSLWGDDVRTWLQPQTPPDELRHLLGPESPDCFEAKRKSANRNIRRPRTVTSVAKPDHVPRDDRERKAAKLIATAIALESVGRTREAACYRRDAANIALRRKAPPKET